MSKIFDQRFAPRLQEIGKEMAEAGMGVILCVDSGDGGIDCTSNVGEFSPFYMRLVQRAAACAGNVDDLILWLLKVGREEGHQSICLKSLEASVRSGS